LKFFTDNFQGTYLDEEMSGEGSDALLILNDLLDARSSSLEGEASLRFGCAAAQPVPVISPLFTACMTRTLQVYMSHPGFIDQLTEESTGSDDNNTERKQLFYSNLALLREFPLPLVLDAHRELYHNHMIKRRQMSSEGSSSSGLKDAYLLSGGYELSQK
jgi:hypothetical protein